MTALSTQNSGLCFRSVTHGRTLTKRRFKRYKQQQIDIQCQSSGCGFMDDAPRFMDVSSNHGLNLKFFSCLTLKIDVDKFCHKNPLMCFSFWIFCIALRPKQNERFTICPFKKKHKETSLIFHLWLLCYRWRGTWKTHGA